MVCLSQIVLKKKNTEGLYKCDKVFKDGPSEIRGKQLLKNLKWFGLLLKNLKWYGSMWSDMVVIWSDMVVIDDLKWHHFKFFKGCLPQILLGPFLNTLPHM